MENIEDTNPPGQPEALPSPRLETQPARYVTYGLDGTLTGCFLQVPTADQAECMILVDESVVPAWPNYRANEARNGLEQVPPPDADIEVLRVAKNVEIDAARAHANSSTFPFGGRLIACDALSRSDIDGVANHIALFDAFPDGFPGGWKATDKTMLPLVDVDAFRSMYRAMAAQGTENFKHSQKLKAQLAAASTEEEIARIQWSTPVLEAEGEA